MKDRWEENREQQSSRARSMRAEAEKLQAMVNQGRIYAGGSDHGFTVNEAVNADTASPRIDYLEERLSAARQQSDLYRQQARTAQGRLDCVEALLDRYTQLAMMFGSEKNIQLAEVVAELGNAIEGRSP